MCRVRLWQCLGLTFKPETDDMREAPSLSILPKLIEDGLRVRAHDPQGIDEARDMLPDSVEYHENMKTLFDDVDAVILFTEWNVYRGMDMATVLAKMSGDTLIDLRNVYEVEHMKKTRFQLSLYRPFVNSHQAECSGGLVERHFSFYIVYMKAWYLIQSKPRQESIAQENLQRQGYDTYLPMAYLRRRQRGRFTTNTGPMFPRYLFIHLCSENDDWRPLRSTVGVSKSRLFWSDAGPCSGRINQRSQRTRKRGGRLCSAENPSLQR